MSEMKKRVESMLKNYPAMTKKLKVLEFEMEFITKSLHPNIIENLVFSHTGEERVSGSFRSDKTANIAIEHVDSQRDERYYALKNRIDNIRQELRRLEHYLSLLPKEEAEAIRWFYFEGLSWDAIAEQTLVTQKTMQRRRKRGVDTLIHYYSIADNPSDS